MSKIKQSSRWLGQQMIRPYTTLFSSMRSLGSTTADAIKQVHETARRIGEQRESSDPDIILSRDIKDSRERFEFLYRQKNWTQRELQQQKSMIARTQLIYLASTLISLIGMSLQVVVFSGLNAFSVVGALCTYLAAAAFGGLTLKHAIYLAQLDERELFGHKQFMARPDFWRRILMPWNRSRAVVSS